MKPLLNMSLMRAVPALLIAGTWPFAGAQTARAPVSPIAMVGTWTSSAPYRDGTLMTSLVTLTQNGRFRGGATVGGKPVWTFSGRWEVRSEAAVDVLTWYYEHSAPELPAASKVDRDDIVAVDGDKMVLRSRLSRKDNVFTRVQ